MLPLQRNRLFLGLFSCAVTGLTACVTVYATAITGFKTIHLSFYLLAVFLLYEMWLSKRTENLSEKNTISPGSRPSASVLLLVLLGCAGVYGSGVNPFLTFGEFPVRPPHEDLVFYSNVSQFLNITGIENHAMAFNVLDQTYHGSEPFHYYELWTNALLYRVWQLPNVTALLMVSFPVFYLIFFFGLLALWESFAPITVKGVVICAALLFAGGVIYFANGRTLLHDSFLFYHKNIFLDRKLGPLYMFSLAFVLAVRYSKFAVAFICLLCITVASTTPFPGIIGGISMFCLGALLLSNVTKPGHPLSIRFDNRFLIRVLAYTLLIAAAYFTFYYLTRGGSGYTLKRVGTASSLLNDILSQGLLQRFVPYTKTTVFVVIAAFPYLVLLAVWFVKYYRAGQRKIEFGKVWFLLIVYLCIAFVASTVWAILYFKLDPQQLAFNITLTMVNVLVCLAIIAVFARLSVRGHLVFHVALALLLLYNVYLTSKLERELHHQKHYSEQFLTEIKSVVDTGNLSMVGVCILPSTEYWNVFRTNTWVHTLGHYLNLMDNDLAVVAISDFEMPLNPNPLEQKMDSIGYEAMVFRKFVARQQEQGEFVSVDKSQVDFVSKHGINFLITQKGSPENPLLQPLIKRSVTDPLSGETFHLLEL